jgi:hypothetical protein
MIQQLLNHLSCPIGKFRSLHKMVLLTVFATINIQADELQQENPQRPLPNLDKLDLSNEQRENLEHFLIHGYPEDLEEFEKQMPLIPDEHNGALIVLEMSDAVKGLERLNELHSKIRYSDKPLNERLTSTEWEVLDAYINFLNARTEKFFPQLEETELSIYPKEIESRKYKPFSILGHIKTLTNDFFSLSGYIHLKNGDVDEFLKTIYKRIQIRKTLIHEPGMLPYLVNLAISDAIFDDIIYCINNNSLTSNQKAQLLDFVKNLNPITGLLHGITAEQMITNSMFKKLQDPKQSEYILEQLRKGFRFLYNAKSIEYYCFGPYYTENNLSTDIKFWNGFFEIANDLKEIGFYPGFWKTYKSLNEFSDNAEKTGEVIYNEKVYTISEFKDLLNSNPDQFAEQNADSVILNNTPLLSALNFPSLLKGFGEKPAFNLTKINIIKAAIQVLNYQESTGQPLPVNLEGFPADLTSKWPIDPYSGNPLHYEKVGDQFRIYSYGRKHLPAITGEGEAVLDKPFRWLDCTFKGFPSKSE